MNPSWPDIYLRHFTYYFHKPFDVQLYRDESGASMRLATFDRAYPKHRVYASLGLSDHPDDLKTITEAILIADDPGKDVPEIFVNALFFIINRRIDVRSRFAIGGIEAVNATFAECFNKSAIYFSDAEGFPPGFNSVAGNGETGAVCQGIFISWSEQDFLNRKGPDAFEEKLRGEQGDPCSLRRPPCA